MTMSQKGVCPECGSGLAAQAPAGLCPQCALKGALAIGEEPTPTTPTAGARVGWRLGDYQLMELLGRGGMGIVYKAHQFSLNQDVALKMVLDGRQGSVRAIRRFQLEAEVAARLRHPNIVRIYHIGEEDGEQFFTMELIEGESLSRRMARGEFRVSPEDQNKASIRQMQVRIARLVVTTARAVHYAHEHGVLHRDIKPGNILIDYKGEPHLTDFGLAKLTDDDRPLSHSGVVKGTPAYMAPEQARGEPVTQAADIYSLGVVFYELLTGRPPFSGATPLETLRLITEQEPPNPTTSSQGYVDSDLATICLKCLEKNPAARYGTALNLAEDLERWLRHEPIRARPVGMATRLQRWVRRNPAGASFIAVLLLGLASTGALVQRVRREREAVKEQQEMVEEQNQVIREGFTRKIDALWAKPDEEFVEIRSEELAALAKIPGRKAKSHRVGTEPPRIPIGLSVTETPVDMAERYAGLLAQLEEGVGTVLGKPVRLDARLFKYSGRKIKAVVEGDCWFTYLGAFGFVHAQKKNPGLVPVVRSDLIKDSVVFVRKGLGITNLSQLAGRRMAFGEPGATISFWAKVELVQAGIRGNDLAEWNHHVPVAPYLNTDQNGGLRKGEAVPIHSHAEAMKRVMKGDADAGVSRREHAQDFTRRYFDIIHHFDSTPVVWIAGDKVPGDIIEAFRRAFIGAGVVLLRTGPDAAQVSKFLRVDNAYFDPLRRAMTNEVAQFEGDRPVQSQPGPIGRGGDDE